MSTQLACRDHDVYRAPFRAGGEVRRPMLAWAQQIPFDGEPTETASVLSECARFLQSSKTPKLFIRAEPGSILVGETAALRRVIPSPDRGGRAGFTLRARGRPWRGRGRGHRLARQASPRLTLHLERQSAHEGTGRTQLSKIRWPRMRAAPPRMSRASRDALARVMRHGPGLSDMLPGYTNGRRSPEYLRSRGRHRIVLRITGRSEPGVVTYAVGGPDDRDLAGVA